uniref:Uncharacterized protein n=1 Tax=Cucumis melo TaxID=3656 RepID=A0A9I9DRE0_CUCME
MAEKNGEKLRRRRNVSWVEKNGAISQSFYSLDDFVGVVHPEGYGGKTHEGGEKGKET